MKKFIILGLLVGLLPFGCDKKPTPTTDQPTTSGPKPEGKNMPNGDSAPEGATGK